MATVAIFVSDIVKETREKGKGREVKMEWVKVYLKYREMSELEFLFEPRQRDLKCESQPFITFTFSSVWQGMPLPLSLHYITLD
jgi:hypothetical protein